MGIKPQFWYMNDLAETMLAEVDFKLDFYLSESVRSILASEIKDRDKLTNIKNLFAAVDTIWQLLNQNVNKS